MAVHAARLKQALATLAEHAASVGAPGEHDFVLAVNGTHELPVRITTEFGEMKERVLQ